MTAAQLFALVDDRWTEDLIRAEGKDGKPGAILGCVKNLVYILEKDYRWMRVLGFNKLTYAIEKRRPPPIQCAETGEWTDADDVRLELWLTDQFNIRRFDKGAIEKAVALVAERHA